jgi:HEPN domain-containing protein
MGINAKYTPYHGVQKAREQYNGYIACWEHPKGSESTRLQHASMCVEHCLKALISHERGVSSVPYGHNLSQYMNSVSVDLSAHQKLIFNLDGMSIYSRYDNVEGGFIKDPEKLANDLLNLIKYVEHICAISHN